MNDDPNCHLKNRPFAQARSISWSLARFLQTNQKDTLSAHSFISCLILREKKASPHKPCWKTRCFAGCLKELPLLLRVEVLQEGATLGMNVYRSLLSTIVRFCLLRHSYFLLGGCIIGGREESV